MPQCNGTLIYNTTYSELPNSKGTGGQLHDLAALLPERKLALPIMEEIKKKNLKIRKFKREQVLSLLSLNVGTEDVHFVFSWLYLF
jgi:hypothetical protein